MIRHLRLDTIEALRNPLGAGKKVWRSAREGDQRCFS